LILEEVRHVILILEATSGCSYEYTKLVRLVIDMNYIGEDIRRDILQVLMEMV